MKRFFAFVLTLGLTMGVPALGGPREYNGSYFCVAEFSAGLSYNDGLKRWESTRFRPSLKFIVRFKYAGPHMIGDQSFTDDYFVTITPSGSDKSEACKTYYLKTSEKIEFTRDVGRGDCKTFLRSYIFSLKYKRFQATFDVGSYVIGMDEKDSDTPSISAGKCTKIQ